MGINDKPNKSKLKPFVMRKVEYVLVVVSGVEIIFFILALLYSHNNQTNTLP
jgi:hypothetical protein